MRGIDDRVVQHFVIPAPSSAKRPMISSGFKAGSADKDFLPVAGGSWVFACDPKLRSSLRHAGTNVAGMVNCLRCRKKQEWIDAPDDNPKFRKNPNETADPITAELDEFLVEPEPKILEMPPTMADIDKLIIDLCQKEPNDGDTANRATVDEHRNVGSASSADNGEAGVVPAEGLAGSAKA